MEKSKNIVDKITDKVEDITDKVDEVTDKIEKTKSFSGERWIWIVLVTGISTMWIAYNSLVNDRIKTYQKFLDNDKKEITHEDSVIEVKSEEIVSLYREISGLENKNKNANSNDTSNTK